jgi:hypothetical protein
VNSSQYAGYTATPPPSLLLACVSVIFFLFYLFSFNYRETKALNRPNRFKGSLLSHPELDIFHKSIDRHVVPWNSMLGLKELAFSRIQSQVKVLANFLTTIFLYRICRNGHCGGRLYNLRQRISSIVQFSGSSLC